AKTALTRSGNNVSVSLPQYSVAVYATANTSGIEDVVTDGEAAAANRVYALSGQIVIEGEYAQASVYTLSGQNVFTGKLIGNIAVAPGIYIVNVDGNATKVLVR
ncbi:MAG: hypothetical protein K2N91_08105, partial [Muribaculaceae bacterium]|nr:hypothetical protein [Muribaculaceae bacterium]